VNSIIVHYQEIALKGKNRPWFLGRLVRNLRNAVSDLPGVTVRPTMGRIELLIVSRTAAGDEPLANTGGGVATVRPVASLDSVIQRIRHTFGIANFAVARRTGLDLDEMSNAILSDLGDRQCRSFRVSARRADKRFPLTSPQLEREVGGRIKAARGWHVDLGNPELEIHLDVLTHDAFYYFDKERGAGGLPTGTAGRVTCLLSGGIDSPVAAHRMMKRGCTVTFVHFHSYPILSHASIDKARELVRLLTMWQQRSRLFLVAFGDIQQQVLLSVPPPMRVVVYRRLMLRIAEQIARKRESQALVTGDVVGQVASQTLENLAVVGHVATLPLFRPLIGMDKDEIVEQSQALGSYPISIIPDQDCCTLFTPRNPLTRARLADIEAAERALPIAELVDKAVHEATCEDFDFPIRTRSRAAVSIETPGR
jgi:thiamine biosynthesis protein ThiI